MDLKDGGLWRKLAAGETVDINLSSIRPGRRTRKSLQLHQQLVRIVRERIDVAALQNSRVRILVGADAQACSLCRDRNLLLVGRDADCLRALAAAHGDLRWTTGLDEALRGPDAIFMDCAATGNRPERVRKAITAMLPSARTVDGDTFGAVGKGLTIEAARRYGADD